MRPALIALPLLLFLFGCEREKRDLRLDPPALEALDEVAPMANGIGGAPPDIDMALHHPYQGNAYQLGQGKRLYEWFNCTGCHANGGGGAGPAFLDGWWRYGPDTVSIFVSIRDGRPRGMPSYHDKLTTEQIWQLTGYVQTIGMVANMTAAPNRNDEMQSRPAESRSPEAADVPPPSR